MWDMADAILNGDFDEVTGEYLGEGQGFPRSLHYENKKTYRKEDARFGVKNYIRSKGLKTQTQPIVLGFGKTIGLTDFVKICEYIQLNFNEFKKYVKEWKQ